MKSLSKFISHKILLFLGLSICLIFSRCSTPKEYLMPFYNFGYTGERLLPIAVSDADFSFRVWINNGTSIERIISISKSKNYGGEAYLDEISVASQRNKPLKFYSKQKTMPTSGIEKFIQKIDSLDLYTYRNQTEEISMELHKPFSLYVVEIKNNGKYHCFRFKTNYPSKSFATGKYDTLQNLILEEFKYKFYFNKN